MQQPKRHFIARPLSLQSQSHRRLRPPRLNILTAALELSGCQRLQAQLVDTAKWRLDNKTETDLEYLFISYTREQFPEQDVQKLHQLAVKATTEVGLQAYWLDSMPSLTS